MVRTCQPNAVLLYDCEALFWRRLTLQAKLVTDQAERDASCRPPPTCERSKNASSSNVTQRSRYRRKKRRCWPAWKAVVRFARFFRRSQRFPLERRPSTSDSEWRTSPGGWREADRQMLTAFAGSWRTYYRLCGCRFHGCACTSPVPTHLLICSSSRIRTCCFEGLVTDLPAFYDRTRVVISPIRFGAGVKVKTVQALQYGVPVVSTSCGSEGIDTYGLDAIAVADDPEDFARLLVSIAHRQIAVGGASHGHR